MHDFQEELRRLNGGPAGASARASIVLAVTPASGGTCQVLDERIREVLRAVVKLRLDGVWTGEESGGKSSLPEWFVRGCRPEMSELEMAAWLDGWRRADPHRRSVMEREKGWTVGAWLHWFAPGPDERQWSFGWSRCRSDGVLEVGLDAEDNGVATGALEWLLRAAGGASISEL